MSLTSCLNSSLASGFGFARADFHEHADFGASMNIGGDQAVAGDFQARVAGDLDVLAHLAHCGFALGFEIGVRIGGDFLGDVVGEGAKRLVAGDEIGFAVDFHEHAGLAAGRDELGDDAFVRLARRLLGGTGRAGFAEDVHRGVQIALCFHESLFAFHHANARHFTELGHIFAVISAIN